MASNKRSYEQLSTNETMVNQEYWEAIDQDSGIVNDYEERLGSNVMDSDTSLEFLLEQDSPNENLFNRRHSLGGSVSVLSPVPRRIYRRSSLQTPNRFLGSLPNQQRSYSEIFISNIGNIRIPRGDIGSDLFVSFLEEEINRSNLKIPQSLHNTSAKKSTHRGTDEHEFLSLGTHLRLMADEFATSDHRRRVRERAESIPLNSLDSESFTDLLFGMFQEGGVTCERVLVLFVFCADLAVRALREHLIWCFNNVINWSQIYIESWLTPWIQRHGGWVVVLERSVQEAYKASVIAVCMVGMLALWTYIRTASH